MLSLLCFIFTAAVGLLVYWYTFHVNATNHSGFDVYWLTPPLALCCVISLLKFRKDLLARVTAILGAAVVIFIIYIDCNNYMVEYERWLRRGMPEKGEPAATPPPRNAVGQIHTHPNGTFGKPSPQDTEYIRSRENKMDVYFIIGNSGHIGVVNDEGEDLYCK